MPYLYDIPGMGDKEAICGQIRMTLECSSSPSHFKRMVFYSCDDIECPTCFWEVAKKDALAAAAALKAARNEFRRQYGFDPGHPYHFWYSPPPSMYDRPLDELRSTAIRYAEKHGIVGGYIVDHPYRFKNDREMTAFRAGELELPYSPHFHVVGFLPSGFPSERSNAFNKRTGWTYGNCYNVNKRGNPRNIYATLLYELSHCAVESWHKHRILKRFGLMHSSKLKAVTDKAREILVCPRCHAPVIRRDPDTGEILGPAYSRPVVHVELRAGSWSWLAKRWPALVELRREVHLDLVKLCGLGGGG